MGGRDADLRGVSFSDTLCVLCADGVCLPGIATLAQSVERLTRNEQVDSSCVFDVWVQVPSRALSENGGSLPVLGHRRPFNKPF